MLRKNEMRDRGHEVSLFVHDVKAGLCTFNDPQFSFRPLHPGEYEPPFPSSPMLLCYIIQDAESTVESAVVG